MKQKIVLLIVMGLLLFGCGKKEPIPKPIPPQPSFAEMGAQYTTETGKIEIRKAYRCEKLIGGSIEHDNAVVLEISADSMEAAQEALKNTSHGRLFNKERTQYQIPVGYTLAADPVTSQLYVIYPTQATTFAPDYQYFVIGDFAASGDATRHPLVFDVGELLPVVDITPFRPQVLPWDITIEDITALLVENLNGTDFDAKISLDEEKIAVHATAPYPNGKTAVQTDGKTLYAAARKTLGRFELRMDSFELTFTDALGVPVYHLDNLNFWKDHNAFYLESYTDKNFIEAIDIVGINTESSFGSINLDKYNRINIGDSLSQVKKIIGSSGECLSTMEIVGIKTEMYAWYGKDGFSTATILFQDGEVISMSQFGL